MGGGASGPNLTTGKGLRLAGGSRPSRLGGAAFHLCGGEGRDRQEEEAHLGVGVSQNQTPGGPGQVPHLLTLACAQDSRGFSGDAPQNRNHWCFNQGG